MPSPRATWPPSRGSWTGSWTGGRAWSGFLSDLLGLVRELVRLKLSGSGKQGDPTLARCAGRFSEEDLLRLWDLLLISQQRLKGTPEADALLELQLVKAALLPRILPLDRLLGRIPEMSSSAPDPQPSLAPPVPAEPRRTPSEPEASPSSVGEEAPPAEGTPPPGGLRFKAIIPFKRMDEDEARTYEDQDDERIHRFRETAAQRLPLMQETLKGASLSLDPDGVLHVALPSSDTTGATLLSNRERREAMEAVARESGLPGPVAVETSAGPEPEKSPSRASSARSVSPHRTGGTRRRQRPAGLGRAPDPRHRPTRPRAGRRRPPWRT